MKKPVTKETARLRLESQCARAEHCEFELMRKMFTWGLSTSESKEILEILKENRYVDDARYARSFANDKARFSAWGPYKIRFELLKRRINQSLIKEAIANVSQQTWKEGLLHNAETKSRYLNLKGEEGHENCQKLYKYLVARGFPATTCSKAVTIMKKRQEEN